MASAAVPRLEGIVAVTAATGVKLCLASLQALSESSDPLISSTLFTGLVVHYARIFENAVDTEDDIVRAFSIRGIPGFDNDLHRHLVHLRNKYLAHAAHDLNDYELLNFTMTIGADLQKDGVDLGPLKVNIPWGTHARASFITGIVDVTRLRQHLNILGVAARRRLQRAMIEHQNIITKRIADRDPAEAIGGEQLSKKIGTVATGVVNSGEIIASFSTDELLFAEPSHPSDIEVDYMTIHYRHITSNGQIGLQEVVTPSKRNSRPEH